MAIKIDSIRLGVDGPLVQAFDFDPTNLNVIHGSNESGKTYIVESMIELLFRTGRRAHHNWKVRGWEAPPGMIILSGLDNGELTLTGETFLDDDWKNHGLGVPQDFSRLLVVRAGETRLTAESENGDGVGRTLLKDYLSGEGLLDRIEGGISITLQNSAVHDRQIDGPRRGEIRTRLQREEMVENVGRLLNEAEESYTSSEIDSLQEELKEAERQIDIQRRAKRYLAATLDNEFQDCQNKRNAMPTPKQFAEIETKIDRHESLKNEVDENSTRLSELETSNEKRQWLIGAQQEYGELVQTRTTKNLPKSAFMYLAAFSVVGALTSGLLGQNAILAIFLAASVCFAILYIFQRNRELPIGPPSQRLETLKLDFKRKIDSKLVNSESFQREIAELPDNRALTTHIQDKLAQDSNEMAELEEEIKNRLGLLQTSELWREAVNHEWSRAEKLDSRIEILGTDLARLNVDKNEYLTEGPEEEWSSDHLGELINKRNEIEPNLQGIKITLATLRGRISAKTGLEEDARWEELIPALQSEHEDKSKEYKQITAEILAKVQVAAVINNLREQENERIAEGLENAILTERLWAITGRYERMELADEGLILVTDGGEKHPLADVSTGAQEQIYLILRMGFASIAMNGEPGFLILDDAFQHSDWPRRQRLVDLTLRLVEEGWQIFYFTMDDHIKGLFETAGAPLGDQFRSLEL